MYKEANLPAQLVAEQKSRRRRPIIFMAVFLVGLAMAVSALPVYRMVKAWRARHLAAEAEAFIDVRRWDDAMQKARAAYQLAPDEPAGIRAIARLQSSSGHPLEAISYWLRLGELHAFTHEDRLHEAEDLFQAGHVPEAQQQNDVILEERPDDPAGLRLAARIAAVSGHYLQGRDYARRAIQADPGNLEGKLLFALLELHSPDEAIRQAGRRDVLELTKDQGKVGLEALTLLAGVSELAPAEAEGVIAGLRAHPLASEDQRLMALDIDIRLHPEERSAIIDRIFAEYRKGDPLKRRALALWLDGHGEYERTLALIPLADALKRRDLLLVYLDALASLKRWSDIEKILGGKNVPLDDFYREVFLARSAVELGESTVASLHWTQAHEAAAPSAEEMWYLATYAEKIGQIGEAERAYRSLQNNGTTARGAFEALLRLEQQKGHDEEVRKLLAEMRQRWPHDDAVTNDYVYLKLLKGLDLQDDLKLALGLVQRSPASMAHRTTLALCYYRLHDSASALAVYNGLQIPWAQVPAANRAVYAAVLGLAGKKEEARKEAEAVPMEALRPEERELIKPWRSS